MLTDLIYNNEVATLEVAFLYDMTLTVELDRIEKTFETISQKLAELINQL